MAKRFNFDKAITTDIKGAALDSYIDNIKMIKVTDIETNSENFYSLPDIEELSIIDKPILDNIVDNNRSVNCATGSTIKI